jgi:hypothetical protein
VAGRYFFFLNEFGYYTVFNNILTVLFEICIASVAIQAFAKLLFSFSDVLKTTNCTFQEVDNIFFVSCSWHFVLTKQVVLTEKTSSNIKRKEREQQSAICHHIPSCAHVHLLVLGKYNLLVKDHSRMTKNHSSHRCDRN